MERKQIPLKNVLIENEKVYLDARLQEGWLLEKKGLFFYQFQRTKAIDQGVYAIHLIDQKKEKGVAQGRTTLPIYQYQQKLSRWRVDYYCSHHMGIQTLTNEEELSTYYQAQRKRALSLANVCAFPLIFSLILLIAKVPVSYFWFALSIIPFILAIRSLMLAEIYSQALLQIARKNGDLVSAEVEYVVSFKGSRFEGEHLQAQLEFLGHVQKMNEKLFKIKTPLSKSDLTQEIAETFQLEKNQYTVMHSGQSYLLI